MKKPGPFDQVIVEVESAEDIFRKLSERGITVNPPAYYRKQAKLCRLAARLLRVAGRADIIGDEQDELCLYDILKLARIIHRAQTLQGKSK